MKNRFRLFSLVAIVILFAVSGFAFKNEAQSAKPYYKFVTTIANNKAQISSQAQYEQVLT